MKHYNDNNEPLHCMFCESSDISNVTVSIDAGHISEYKVICNNCNKEIGYWAYGSFDLNYAKSI